MLATAAVHPLVIADSGSPVSGSSSELTVYDDGWALLAQTPGMFMAEADYEHTERTYRVPMTQVDALRDLLAGREFVKADSHYHEEGVLDGGATTFVGGDPLRRIVVVNRPPLPSTLQRLSDTLWDLTRTTRDEGRDPFEDTGLPTRARIVLRYDYGSPGGDDGADRVTVFDDGLVEYRHTAAAKVPRRGDYPTPTAITRRLGRARLASIRARATDPAVARVDFLGRERSDKPAASHHFTVRGKVALRFGVRELEPALQGIVDAIWPVRLALRDAHRA